jgi:1,4-alpha-glucan branching enzyme
MGFTHLELLPVSEHPFYGSWGYQPTGLYAPTARLRVRRRPSAASSTLPCRRAEVILDWVPAHFPTDEHGWRASTARAVRTRRPARRFPPRLEHAHLQLRSPEVRNFLVGNALYWLEQYGIDGLRVDAVASMLYRDYSRKAGEWVPNRDGGRENYEAIAFLREVNEVCSASECHRPPPSPKSPPPSRA